jgi:uncharacterized protein
MRNRPVAPVVALVALVVAPVVALAALVAAPAASAVTLEASETVRVHALAVAQTDRGFVGALAAVEARVFADGSGGVFVDTRPLSETDMQASARLAARVAAGTLGLAWDEYDHQIVMRSASAVIGGPSAGGVMALALTVALQNLAEPQDAWELDARVAATGTINPDGTIGPVGGIPAKAEAAARAGITHFLYPAGQDIAATLAADEDGVVQQVLVDMQEHCDSLNIRCTPAATLTDLLLHAANVRLVLPPVAQPDTSAYEAELRPSVQDDVDRLATRISDAYTALAAAVLGDVQRAAVAEVVENAAGWLDSARSALDAGKFYQAATFAFRGQIFVGHAESLVAFYAAAEQEPVVADAVTTCTDAAQQADSELADDAPHDMTAWLAVAAAQQRAAAALDLARQADLERRDATRVQDWVSSLHTASFCVERAASARWWAGLADIFPAGEARVGDADALVTALIERAEEAVAYADAVGVDAGIAHARLSEAEAAREAGRLPQASLAAVQAEAAAGVAMQAVSGHVADDVLAAAQDVAARAVAAARLVGLEPIVSVSLIELAESETDDAARLASYREARGAALLSVDVDGAAPVLLRVPRSPLVPASLPVVAFVAGVVAGAGLVGLIVLSVTLLPRRRW